MTDRVIIECGPYYSNEEAYNFSTKLMKILGYVGAAQNCIVNGPTGTTYCVFHGALKSPAHSLSGSLEKLAQQAQDDGDVDLAASLRKRAAKMKRGF